MKKADYKFHRNAQGQIKLNQDETQPTLSWFGNPANRPIYILKRKKKK